MSRVLVVEDEPAILRGLADNLRLESYEVLTASDGDDGYRLLCSSAPDLVILDLMLPKMNGLEVCRKARAGGIQVPILMLTARGQEMDRVIGLDHGADDYVSKPFSLPELLARVRSLLRRSQFAAAASPVLPHELIPSLRFGQVFVDFAGYEARNAGILVEMTRKEFQVLRYLASRSGEVITREELLDKVWGVEKFPTTRTVDNHILSLRAKVEVDPTRPQRLVTVHGVGYKWVAEPADNSVKNILPGRDKEA